MTIKPIETVYQGYRFRSRLEARYAVFFDTLGIQWEYEKEGYDLDGVWYLPDFWLPDLQRWIEIKGQSPTKSELAKVEKLHNKTDQPSCLFYGLPGENYGWGYFDCLHDSSGGSASTDQLEWKVCPVCHTADVDLRHKWDCTLLDTTNTCIHAGGSDCLSEIDSIIRPAQAKVFEKLCAVSEARGLPSPLDRKDWVKELLWLFAEVGEKLESPQRRELLEAAYTAARQARFEHGEKPRSR